MLNFQTLQGKLGRLFARTRKIQPKGVEQGTVVENCLVVVFRSKGNYVYPLRDVGLESNNRRRIHVRER